jgi:hypothetical protein
MRPRCCPHDATQPDWRPQEKATAALFLASSDNYHVSAAAAAATSLCASESANCCSDRTFFFRSCALFLKTNSAMRSWASARRTIPTSDNQQVLCCSRAANSYACRPSRGNAGRQSKSLMSFSEVQAPQKAGPRHGIRCCLRAFLGLKRRFAAFFDSRGVIQGFRVNPLSAFRYQ